MSCYIINKNEYQKLYDYINTKGDECVHNTADFIITIYDHVDLIHLNFILPNVIISIINEYADPQTTIIFKKRCVILPLMEQTKCYWSNDEHPFDMNITNNFIGSILNNFRIGTYYIYLIINSNKASQYENQKLYSVFDKYFMKSPTSHYNFYSSIKPIIYKHRVSTLQTEILRVMIFIYNMVSDMRKKMKKIT